MAYEPTEWKNREVERPRTFTIQNNEDGSITLIPSEGHVAEPGTPIMAANMNKIEQGIVDVSEGLKSYMPLTGGNFTGPVTVDGAPIGGDDIDARMEDVTYYIRTTGDDNNDGLTEISAFKTFHKAITTLKKINFGKRIINCAAGIDMAGPNGIDYRKHELSGYMGGSFEFNMGGVEYAPQWKDCTTNILIQNFIRYDSGISGHDGYGDPCGFTNCQLAEVVGMTVNRTGKQSSYAVIEFQNTRWGRVATSTLTNVGTEGMVRANLQSYVYTWNINGNVKTTSDVPFHASQGSILEIIGSGVTGYAVRDQVDTGGQIFGA